MNLKQNQLNMWEDLPKALKSEESIELIKKYRETKDEKILDQIVFGNMRLATSYLHKMKVVNNNSQNFVDFEDFSQDAAIVLVEAVNKFDTSKDIKFSTFVCTCIKNMLHNRYRKLFNENNVCSLNEKVFDEVEDEYINTIEDKEFVFGILDSKVEYLFLKNKILSLLTKKDRQLFEDVFIIGMPTSTTAIKHGLSRPYVDEQIKKIIKKIKNLYTNGVTELDVCCKAVRTTDFQERRIKKRLDILKKFSPEFLRERFIPLLTQDQAIVFENFVLNYYGQTFREVSEKYGLNIARFSDVLKACDKKLEKYEIELLEEFKTYKAPEQKNQKQRDFANKIAQTFGGKLFLQKYFVPILNNQQKKVFKCAIMDYNGQNYSQLAKDCNMTNKQFATSLMRVIKRLKSLDFDLVVDVLDNSEFAKTRIDALTSKDLNQIKQNVEIVKDFGGVLKLKKLFAPSLNFCQNQIFNDLYLHPKYQNLESFAEQNKITLEKAVIFENEAIEKLKCFDLEKVEILFERAKHTLKASEFKVDKSVKKEIIKNLRIFEIGDVEDFNVRKAFFDDYLKNYGQKKDIIAQFLPSLKKLELQQTFVSFFLEAHSDIEIMQEFGFDKDYLMKQKVEISVNLLKYKQKNKKYIEKTLDNDK